MASRPARLRTLSAVAGNLSSRRATATPVPGDAPHRHARLRSSRASRGTKCPAGHLAPDRRPATAAGYPSPGSVGERAFSASFSPSFSPWCASRRSHRTRIASSTGRQQVTVDLRPFAVRPRYALCTPRMSEVPDAVSANALCRPDFLHPVFRRSRCRVRAGRRARRWSRRRVSRGRMGRWSCGRMGRRSCGRLGRCSRGRPGRRSLGWRMGSRSWLGSPASCGASVVERSLGLARWISLLDRGQRRCGVLRWVDMGAASVGVEWHAVGVAGRLLGSCPLEAHMRGAPRLGRHLYDRSEG